MWIVWTILGLITALIVTALALPVDIILKTDEQSKFSVLYKVLFITFGNKPSSDKKPLMKTLKKKTELDSVKGNKLLSNLTKDGIIPAVLEIIRLLKSVLVEVKGLFKRIKVKRFDINIVCSGEDAADAAVRYGQYCAVVYPVVGYLTETLEIHRKVNRVGVFCDYGAKEDSFDCHIDISVRVFRVVGALLRIVVKELMYKFEQQNQKDASSDTNNNSIK